MKTGLKSWTTSCTERVGPSLTLFELTQNSPSTATNMSDDHQFMMFSATFPPAARQLAAKYLTGDHAQIHVGRLGSSHENIHQVVNSHALLSLIQNLTIPDCLGRIEYEVPGAVGSPHGSTCVPHNHFLCFAEHL